MSARPIEAKRTSKRLRDLRGPAAVLGSRAGRGLAVSETLKVLSLMRRWTDGRRRVMPVDRTMHGAFEGADQVVPPPDRSIFRSRVVADGHAGLTPNHRNQSGSVDRTEAIALAIRERWA